MTPQEVAMVQESWQLVLPIRKVAAGLFYKRLFELDSALQPLFRADMEDQGRKLMQMITVVVNGLGQLEVLTPAVQDLGRRHNGYGVHEKDYATVAAALLWTLEQSLREAFSPTVKAAWIKAYGILAQAMNESSAPRAA